MAPKNSPRKSIVPLCIAGICLAFILLFSSFGFPIPGGNIYLVDVIIIIAGCVLPPGLSFLCAGLGCFLGDALFYPSTMLLSFFLHGLQGFCISYFRLHLFKNKSFQGACLGSILGAVITIVGYTLAKGVLYASWPIAWAGLPYEILQSVIGSCIGLGIVYKFNLLDPIKKLLK